MVDPAGGNRTDGGRGPQVVADGAAGFRFYHLLRYLLRLEADRAFPDRVPELHARAAAWFEAEDDHGQAIVHRLAAGEVHEAARLLRVEGPRLMALGQIDTLRGLLDQLGGVARTITWCALLHGWCDFIGGRHAGAQAWLDVMTDVAPAGFDHSVGVPLAMNIALARGDIAGALDTARRMMAEGQLVSRSCELATATGAAYLRTGRLPRGRAGLRHPRPDQCRPRRLPRRCSERSGPGPAGPPVGDERDGREATGAADPCGVLTRAFGGTSWLRMQRCVLGSVRGSTHCRSVV